MNIIITGIERWEAPLFKRTFKKTFKGHRLQLLKEPITEKNAFKFKNVQILSPFISSQLTKEILCRLPKLKLIATRSTGFDHIDIQECNKRKITVCNVPAYSDNTVAEHTFALMLALARKLVPSIERTKKGDFHCNGLRGADLRGKVLGVVGTGKIGRHVIRIAKGFEMDVLAYTRHPDQQFAKEQRFHYVSLDKLLRTADIITLHCPLTKETHHLINSKNINRIKKGTFLINTARGGLVETDALVQALKKGMLAGAALDVLEEENEMNEEIELLAPGASKKFDMKTLFEQHILLEMGNVIITPHNAFNSDEAVQRLVGTTIKNIHAFINKKPINVVTAGKSRDRKKTMGNK